METIRVNVEKEYSVNVGIGLLDEIGPLLRDISDASKVAVISDTNVFALYGERVVANLQGVGFKTCSFAFLEGEQSKNFQTLESVLNFLVENGVQRSDVVLALGGGVVGDVAGFAASVYMRGIEFIQVPTTLLAMVDASIGGKTGVNLDKGKNLAGNFWQPLAVFCDLDALNTLPPAVFAEGMGEVIKTNAIAGLGFSEVLTEGANFGEGADPMGDQLDKIITACIEYKSKIVSEDELDNKGIRAVLNAGHTIGHCIEKLSGYAIPHGKAVANGLLIEAAMAVELDLCDLAFLETLKSEVSVCGLLMDDDGGAFDPDRWIESMALDKKNAGDEISFILPEGAGKYVTKKLKAEEVKKLLEKETLKPLLKKEK